ncbi:MAG: LytR/AlgR family response regulator transcription factor, partial [Oscillospiraceae bacterium]
SSSKDFALEGYRVQATRYLLKPVKEKELEELLLQIGEKALEKQVLMVCSGRQARRVYLHEIEYIEQVGRKAVICTPHEEISYSDTLSNLYQTLPQDEFVRCHQGYVVNLHHVMVLEGLSLELRSGRQIPISRSRYKTVKLFFLKKMSKQGSQ